MARLTTECVYLNVGDLLDFIEFNNIPREAPVHHVLGQSMGLVSIAIKEAMWNDHEFGGLENYADDHPALLLIQDRVNLPLLSGTETGLMIRMIKDNERFTYKFPSVERYNELHPE